MWVASTCLPSCRKSVFQGEALLKQGEETTTRAAKGRAALLKTLTAELAAHELKEEKVLYPALKRHHDARDIVLEGYE